MGRTRRIQDDFEEIISLIDLPISPMKPISNHDVKSSFMIREQYIKNENRACLKTEEDKEEQSSKFDFGSTRFEMSSADELFLHGQILPFRLSVDSRMSRVVNPGRPESLSGSSSVGFTSSRSSSYSSSTSSVKGTNVVKTTASQTKIRNQFHAHPIPTPRLRGLTDADPCKISSSRCRKSSVWDVFRLGLVQQLGIELKDLKTRNPVNSNHNVKTQSFKVKNDKRSDQILTLKQSMFGLGNVGCRYTAEAVENVQTRILVMKTGERRSDFKESEIEEVLKRKMEKERRRRRKHAETAAEVLPGRRTFERLKQLSVEGDVY